jgi:hypothetical protein
MIELILLANLFVLILVLMMLRTWLPLLKKTNYLSSRSSGKQIEAIITIPQSTNIQEQFSITPIGFSKKFEQSVILEMFKSFSEIEKSTFHHATLSFVFFENAFDLVKENSGFVVDIRCFEDSTKSSSYIEILCDQLTYEFLKDQIQINATLSLSLRDAEIFERSGLEDFAVKSRKIDINLENSEASVSSLRRFIKRFNGNPELLTDSYLEGWYKKYKDSV